MKPTKRELLEKMAAAASHNIFCYSHDYAMTKPKEGHEEAWQEAKDELDVIMRIAKVVERNENPTVGEIFGDLKFGVSRLESRVAAMREVLEDILAVINGSHGVAGWHLNGDIAAWEEFGYPEKIEDCLWKGGIT